MASTWTLNSPRWTPGRWKDVHIPIEEGICYSGKRYQKERSEGMPSEMVCQKEIESWNFICSTCPPRERVCLRDHCQTLCCYSFSLHLSSCPTCNIEHGQCQGESFVSVPEITLIPVKLTLCKVSRPMLSPVFSIFTFSLDGAQTKEKGAS